MGWQMLPRVDGLELVAALRQNPSLSRMRVVFITGSNRLDIHFARLDGRSMSGYPSPAAVDLLPRVRQLCVAAFVKKGLLDHLPRVPR